MSRVLDTAVETHTPTALKRAWSRLRASEPELRARDLAHRLGVSEGELVACRVGERVTRLAGPWADLLRAMPGVGRVMVLTRNQSCVHEKKGAFKEVNIGEAMGAVVGGPIDLRVFLRHFRHGYAVNEESRGRQLESLQFFDADGTAVHKIYRLPDTDGNAWRQLVSRFNAGVQTPLLEPRTVAPPLPHLLQDDAVDAASLRAGWRRMGYGPHEFYGLLRRHRVTRLQALHVAGSEFARRTDNAAVERALEAVVGSGLPIMVFTGSPGMVQIHAGPVHRVRRMGPWLNVLDEDFNLHLRTDHIAESWVVKKPTAEGPVTSLEMYDADGNQIVQLFGQRQPGHPEREAWTALADSLVTEAGHA